MKLQDKSNHTKFMTDERGYLVTTAKLARVGAMEYLGEELGRPSGVYDVYVDADELFNDATIKSFENMPVTIDHPEEQEVTSSNWDDLAVGHIYNVRPSDDKQFLLGDVVVNSPKAIKTINDGKVEVSCGYDADLVENDGIIRKVNIRGNHLAIVDEGRCGKNCKLGDGKPSIMSKLLKRFFGDKKAKVKVKLGDSKRSLKAMSKKLNDSKSDFDAKFKDAEEIVVSPDATTEEKAAVVQELQEMATELMEEATTVVEEAQAATEQAEELAAQVEQEVPSDTTANDELTPEEEAKMADLEAQVIEKDERIAELEAELEALKEKEEQATTANDAKRVFGDAIAIKKGMTSTEIKRAVVVKTGAYNDSTVKTLTDCALNSAYAAALTVAATKPQIGKKLLADSKPQARKLAKALGGK